MCGSWHINNSKRNRRICQNTQQRKNSSFLHSKNDSIAFLVGSQKNSPSIRMAALSPATQEQVADHPASQRFEQQVTALSSSIQQLQTGQQRPACLDGSSAGDQVAAFTSTVQQLPPGAYSPAGPSPSPPSPVREGPSLCHPRAHTINLLPSPRPPRGRLYYLSLPETADMEK